MGEPERKRMRVVEVPGNELSRFGVNIDTRDALGQHLIHHIAKEDNSDLMAELLERDPNNHKTLSALRDRMEDTPIHTAVQNHSKRWLSVVLGSDQLKNVGDKIQLLQLTNCKKETALSLATANKSHFESSFMAIFKSFKPEEYQEFFQATIDGHSKSTALHQAIEMDVDEDYITVLLQSLVSDEQRKQILMMPDIKGKTSLHLAVMDGRKNSGPLLKCLLNSLTSDDYVCEILSKACNAGFTPLHMIVDQPMIKLRVVQIVLSAIKEASEEKLQTLVCCQDFKGCTALHYAVETCKAESPELQSQQNEMNADCLLEFFKLPIDLPPILRKTDRNRQTLLHYAARSSLKALQSVIGSIKQTQRTDLQELLKMQDNENDTVFHAAAVYGTAGMMEYLLALDVFSEETRLACLKIQGSKQMSVLQCAANRPDVAMAVISFLQDPKHLCSLLSALDKHGATYLHSLLSNARPTDEERLLVTTILGNIQSADNQDISHLLDIGDDNQNTILHLAAENGYPGVLEGLSSILTVQRLKFLSKSGHQGKSVLQACGADGKTISLLLEQLLPVEKHDLIIHQDDNGETILHNLVMPKNGKRECTEFSAECKQALSLILRTLSELDECLNAVRIENSLGGSPLDYAFDLQNLTPEPLQGIARMIPLHALLDAFVIDENSWKDLKSNLATTNLSSLTANQRYVIRFVHFFDQDDPPSDACIVVIKEKICAYETEQLKKIVNTIENRVGKLTSGTVSWLHGKYENGNNVLHMLAKDKNINSSIIKLFLEKLTDDDRVKISTARNRKGENASDLTDDESTIKHLEWSAKQDGFYYLSTAPTVLVMYSTKERQGFQAEVNAFVSGLDNTLDLKQRIIKDPTSSEVLHQIRLAQLQPNISALIVVYMSHGTSGRVLTYDGTLHIQQILLQMCAACMENIPKVLMVQACQSKDQQPSMPMHDLLTDAQVIFGRYRDHFDVRHRDVVAILATVNGGFAYRNLMIPEFAKELGKSREALDKTGSHEDITHLFYKTHLAVKRWCDEENGRLGHSRYEQICELRTTCTKSLSLTKMFRPPSKIFNIYKCTAYRYF